MEELKNNILNQYPTWESFLKDQGPEQLIVNYNDVMRLSDVYNSTPVTLLFLTETYNLKNTMAGFDYLKKWLSFLNDFLNINKGIPERHISQLAYSLYVKNSNFRLSDLKLLLDYILESKYGTFYGSVDTQRIVSSFADYTRERNELFGKIAAKKEEEEKKSEKEENYTLPDFSRLTSLNKILNNGDTSTMAYSLAKKLKS